MKKVFIKKGETFAERMPIKSGPRDFYITHSIIHHENTGIQQMRLGMIELEPGQVLGEHKHNCDEIMYALEGKGTWLIDGKEYSAEPGDAVYVAPDAIHGGHMNTGNTVWRYLYVVGQLMEPLTSKDARLPSGEPIIPKRIK